MPSISFGGDPLVRRKIFGIGRNSGDQLSSRSTARGERMRIPWAPSPPSTFCHEKVTTSSLCHGAILTPKIAEVASQIVSPSRSSEIHSAAGGTHTPEVVPFQQNTRSLFPSTFERSGSSPYRSAARERTSGSWRTSRASANQPLPKLSQWHTSTARAPSSVHIAISTAPVSDAGTMPTR